jgi:hypothetical protein
LPSQRQAFSFRIQRRLFLPPLPSATVPSVKPPEPPARDPASQDAIPLVGMAAAAGGVLLIVVIVVVLLVCRRRPQQSAESGLVGQDGLEPEMTTETDWSLPGTVIPGHHFDNPLAETVVVWQDQDGE